MATHIRSDTTMVKKGIMLTRRMNARCIDHLALRQKAPATKKNAGMRMEQIP